MRFDEAMREAARRASDASQLAMQDYAANLTVDEDDLTGVLVGALKAKLQGDIGGLRWKAKILRHRSGSAAEEQKFGADLLIHVSIDTRYVKYAKGVLVQSKKVEPQTEMTISEHKRLTEQCRTMLTHTPSAYVFDYAKRSMRVGSASRIAGTSSRELYTQCTMTPYRFFRNLFECPIGDTRVMPEMVTRYMEAGPDSLKAPSVLELDATGDI